MALLSLTQPLPFLQSPGEPTITFDTWLRSFETYLIALSEKELADKRKRALLIHCIGVEAQRIFYHLEMGTSYEDATKALKAFFMPKVNVVAERNKFRLRSQNVGESVVHYIAALRELASTCEFGEVTDDMIRDQLVEKTNSSRIRERLLLETGLTLQKAVTLASQIETVLAEAKAMAKKDDGVVGAVHDTTFRGGGKRQTSQHHRNDSRFAPKQYETTNPSAGKKCYRCGSSSHLANSSSCPAKSVTCNKCHKTGHYGKVCKSMPASTVKEVSDVTVLSIGIENENDIQTNKLWCNVSLQAACGTSVNTKLPIDTGSAVSIIPQCFYEENFKDFSLTSPTLRLMTYTKTPIPVLGCLALNVTCNTKSANANLYVVPGGTPILGMDLFTALRLDISSDCMHSSTPPTIPVKHTTAVAELGEVVNFVHKVKVRSEITPVQQKLRRLPFSIRDEGTAELLRLEKEGIIERADSSFNYTIEYKRGCDNVIADCLSRLPLPDTDFNVEPDMEMIALVSDDFAAITMEELTAACKDCLILQQVRAYIRTGWPCTAKGLDPALVPYFRIHTELAEHDECVIRGTHRVVVPREIQPKLIQIAHDTHQGIVRTKQRLRELYWWPGMDAAVETAIKSCVTCTQHDKTAIVRASPLNPVSLPNAAWEKLAVDFVGPYLRAPPDCRYAITLVDYYSKWPEVAFTSGVTSATAIKFLSTVFSREGNPIELVTDNGSAFVSAEFEAFLASRDIKHCRSSIYYPRCNGEVERWNRCLKDCLQTADIEGKPWKQFTTDFLFSYCATPHAITQVSPAELLHGRPMNTKLNIRGLPTRPMQLDDAELRDTVKKKQLKSKEYTDKRRSAQIPTFQVGGFVRIKKPTLIKKGAHKFTKPLQIIEQRGPATFRLSDGKMWNASHLAPALPVNMPVPPTPPPPDETHELLQATPPDTA